MKKIFIILIISISILTGCNNRELNKEKEIMENNKMLSYTIDGEKTDIKPTKEDGYIVNKIICDNRSDMMWDNDNWEVELTKVNSKDRCKVDFTKDTSKEGYRVTVTSNMTSALDSLSKVTTLNGTVIIYSTSKIESVTGCAGVIKDNKVIVNNVTSNQTCNITIEDKTLAGIVKESYPPQAGRTSFSGIDDGTPGLYTGIDDQGETYYFSGDGTNMNNWVNFAGKKWRIIRINGNGSVRLLYAGDGTSANDIGINIYNANRDHPANVGWKYTKGGSLSLDRENTNKSNAYQIVENWYDSLSSIDKNYIDGNAIYCNDRNIGIGTYSTSSNFYYATYARISRKESPIFTCSNTNDIFTIFGLMTADEVVAAGGLYERKSPKAYYYLNATGIGSITGDTGWWTMSPSHWYSSTLTFVFGVYGSTNPGYLGSNYVDDNIVIRPVISLKKEVQVTGGDGSGSNPYTVILP